jgi:hypothetical protein
VQFEDESGKLSKQRLLLSTHSTLSAAEVFKYYARRWSIEDLFNQMKNGWGWRETWQQSRQVLHRWAQILSAAYALPKLLSTYCSNQMEDLLRLTPWRNKAPVTAGQVRLGLQIFFSNVRVRDWWNPTCRKFQPGYSSAAPGVPPFLLKLSGCGNLKNKRADTPPPPSS